MDLIGQEKAYCRQAQQIVLNVWNYFPQSTIPNPVKSTMPATMEATGVKRSTLRKLRQNGVTSLNRP